jgi:PAP2 superfamily
VSGSSELGVLAGCYYAILHFAVTIIALVWLYRRHRALYRHARTVLITASTASLLVFWFYPVAPPRLAMHGLEDTVVTHNVLGAGHAASTGTFVDLYAALPSLHVGWAFWVAATIVRAHATARYRHLAWLYPMTTALVVLATANHYLVDAAAGVTVIALAELAHLRRARPRASVDHRDRTIHTVVPKEAAMSDTNGTGRPPLGIRLLHALGKELDWSAMTPEDPAAFAAAQNRKRSSPRARLIRGQPDRGATVHWQEMARPDRKLRVRVYTPVARAAQQPSRSPSLVLVVHVHGGALVGTRWCQPDGSHSPDLAVPQGGARSSPGHERQPFPTGQASGPAAAPASR